MSEPHLNQLEGVDAAAAQVPAADGWKPVIRLMISALRTDQEGRHQPFQLPHLWLERHEAVALAQAILSAAEKLLPPEAAPVDSGTAPQQGLH